MDEKPIINVRGLSTETTDKFHRMNMLNAPGYVHIIAIILFIVLFILYYIVVYTESFQDVRDNFSYWKKQLYFYTFFMTNDNTIQYSENPNQIRELISAF